MNKQEVTDVLCELYKISGFRVSLHGVDFREIAAYPEEKLGFCAFLQNKCPEELNKCLECDKDACKRALSSSQTIIYKCRHGLIEAISPLYNFGALTGFLMMGQVCADTDGKDGIIKALAAIGIGAEESDRILAQVRTVDSATVKSYVHIMTVCAQYLTLSNAVTSTKPSLSQMIIKYISENYTRKISVSDICDDLGYSKSTVLSYFKRQMGTTVGAYLNDFRLERAKRMMDDTQRTINDIALSTGFSDGSYFSKVFLSKYGITPSEYRRASKR